MEAGTPLGSWLRCYRCWSTNLEVQVHYEGIHRIDPATGERAEVGDLVVIFQAGAYGLTASPTAFLGHPAPAEILV